jgi:hypothetical protein
MLAILLGKIAVPTPGTPVALTLTAAQRAQLPTNGEAILEVCNDTADSGRVMIKIGAAIATILPAGTTATANWRTPGPVQPTAFGIDANTAGNGPYVTLWVG